VEKVQQFFELLHQIVENGNCTYARHNKEGLTCT